MRICTYLAVTRHNHSPREPLRPKGLITRFSTSSRLHLWHYVSKSEENRRISKKLEDAHGMNRTVHYFNLDYLGYNSSASASYYE